MNFTIKDVGGVVHQLSLSTDPRGLAMDALPRNMSSRRLAHDQELDDLFNGLDEETAYAVACQLLEHFPGLEERLDRLPDSGENSGTGADRRRARDAKSAGSNLGAQDAALAAKRRMANRADTFERFPMLKRIGGA